MWIKLHYKDDTVGYFNMNRVANFYRDGDVTKLDMHDNLIIVKETPEQIFAQMRYLESCTTTTETAYPA